MRWTRAIQSRWGRIVLAGLAWTLVGLIFAIPNMLHGGGLRALLATQSNWWVWGLMSPLVLAFDRHMKIPYRQFLRRLRAFLAYGFVLTPVYVAAAAGIEYWLGLNDWSPLSYPLNLIDWYLWSWLIYLTMVGALMAYRYYVRYITRGLTVERLKRQYLQARMNALRMQLDPHFLFNALNAISSEVEREPKLARDMIGYLGDLLRLSLMSKDSQTVSLEEELAFLDPYLALQKIRFGDRLRVEIRVPDSVRSARVPNLLLQPLAENAIRHGVSPRVDGGRVMIEAERDGQMLIICVADDGVGLPPGWRLDSAGGIGLMTTKRRLQGMYPDGACSFRVEARDGGGTCVRMRIPFRCGDVS